MKSQPGADPPSFADKPLLAFISGAGQDDRDRSISDVLAFDFETLAETHDYIQWRFLGTRTEASALPNPNFEDNVCG